MADTKPEAEAMTPELDAYYWARYERDAPGGEKRLAAAESALLAALTPQPSADDVAVVDAFEDAVIERVIASCSQCAGAVPTFDEAKKDEVAARAAVLARMAGKVPPGYKLVPVEPTMKMMQAVADADALAPTRTSGNPFALFKTLWRAAWMAAPEAPR